MIDWKTVHDVIELLYFLSGIAIAVAAVFALRQVSLFKEDMEHRSERAAKEKAMEYTGRFNGAYRILERATAQALVDASLEIYKGPVSDFTWDSIPPALRDKSIARSDIPEALIALNGLEEIAFAFVLGVADEREGFKVLGKTFCEDVELYYDVIAESRRTWIYYQPIVELYGVWSSRLRATELHTKKHGIEAELSKIGHKTIKPIGG